jgi:hypothetical protein
MKGPRIVSRNMAVESRGELGEGGGAASSLLSPSSSSSLVM